jgi:predicted ribosome quality control (RQC) complex YloA/Tae2 family protein
MYKEEYKSDDIIFKIIVGRNSKENWDLIDNSESDDLWFHVEDKPSCHVFIKKPFNCDIFPKDVIIRGAQLCKEYSKYKHDKKVKIIYTTINNIKKSKEIGSVTILNIKKLEIIII